MIQTTIKRSMLNAGAWLGDTKPSWSFSMIEDLLGSLPPIEDIWARLPDNEAVALLQQREQLLGVATLSCHSFSLLHEIIGAVGIPNLIWRHTPSFRAAEKQVVLDAVLDNKSVFVNKTVTIRLDTMHLLCTGVGDFTVNRRLLSAVANELRLPKRVVKDCHINPTDYSPEYELGLLTGMVSPFLPPWVSSHRLQAVVLLTETDVGQEQMECMVAISLSPFESLLLPFAQFHVLAQMYARRAYPYLQWIEIDRHAATPGQDASVRHQIGETDTITRHKVAARQALSGNKICQRPLLNPWT